MADLQIIEVSSLFGSDPAARAAVDRQLGAAIGREGGFVVTGYPEAHQVDRRARLLTAFFALPAEVKRELGTRVHNPESQRLYRGYVASLGEDSWAHNEMFDLGPAEPTGGPALPGVEMFAETNAWPAEEPVPGWRAAAEAYYAQMRELGMALLLSLGRWAGIAEADLLDRFEGGNSTLRLLNYPKRPDGLRIIDELREEGAEGTDAPRLAAGRHTDGSGLSLLWQGQPGLQAQAPDGRWRDVPAVADCISVHLGDVLDIMTEGKVPATPHRVLDIGGARQSIGFFLEPTLAAQLSPIAPGAAAEGARGSYGWHLLRRFHGYAGYEALVPYPD